MSETDIIFSIGEEQYGFDVQLVTGIEPITDIVAMPNAPGRILGLMNLRGEVIPVYSLRRKFLMEELTDQTRAKLIVTQHNGKLLAFKVDEVLEMVDFPEEAITETPIIAKSPETAYVRAIANKQGRLVLLLNPSMMYEGNEEEQVAEAMRRMQS